MGGDYRAVIRNDAPDYKLFMGIYGRNDVPIVSPVAEVVFLINIQELQPCYMVDLNALSADEKAKIFDFLMRKYGLLEDEVHETVANGLPLRVDQVLFVVGNPTKDDGSADGFMAAKGILGDLWDGEPAEDTIRRLRDGDDG